MTLQGYSSEQAFSKIFGERELVTKHDFIESISNLKGVEFSAPEFECMFKHFDQNRDGRIDLREWSSRIYEDSANPLALIREVIKSTGLDSDDLLHKMGL